MKLVERNWLDKHGPSLNEASKVLAKQSEPTRESFEGLARMVGDLLTQLEAQAALIEKYQKLRSGQRKLGNKHA